ncbi:extensin family protein [Roseobacteraceae bacterium S113]
MRWGIALALLASPVLAAPETSPRPVARASLETAAVVAQPLKPKLRPAIETTAPTTAIDVITLRRPKARPDALASALVEEMRIARREGAAAAPTSDDLAANTPGVRVAALDVRSLRPLTRPKSIVQKAMARKREERAGNLAGVRGVQGENAGRVPGNGGCGIAQAYRVTHVSGIRLSTAALMDAGTVKALKRWVDKGLKPAVGTMGGGVASIRVVAHYACRTRNSQPGARLSEHAKGRAIDIAGFTLRDGSKITVLTDWSGGSKGRALRQMHRSACGPFGTVLGPEANRFHRDHFHFDTARYRSGSYCR